MRSVSSSFFVLLAFLLGIPSLAACQDTPELLQVGEVAPEIELTGATRHGVLVDPVKLSDFRGETVVLAFFFKARTGG
jgi:peroxiredoxin Q/BCP